MKKIFAILIIQLFSYNLLLSQSDSIKKQPANIVKKITNRIQKFQEGNVRFVPVPTFSVSPERGASFGLLLEYLFNAGVGEGKKITRVSNAYTNVQYTTLNQLIAEGVYSIYTNKEKYFLQGAIGYRDFYERFWTFSKNNVANNDYKNVDYKTFYARGKWVHQLRNKNFIGINFWVSSFYDVEISKNNIEEDIDVSGKSGSYVVGVGPLYVKDERDNQFSPTKGWYAEAGLRFHDKAIGSQYNFNLLNADLRRYITLKEKNILAFNCTATLTNGELPLLEKVRLGNDKIMRGYFTGRFRDNEFFAAQAEYRRLLGKNFVAAAFMSFGQTAPTLKDFNTQDLQSAAGAGLRYLLNRDKKIYIRFDAAYTKLGTWGYYINLGDAF